MPFKSQAQQRYMFSQHPEIAHRWADEMKSSKRKGAKKHPIKAAGLPDHVEKAKRLKLERGVQATRDQRIAATWPVIAATGGHDEARRLLKIRRLQKVKSNVRIIRKAGVWVNPMHGTAASRRALRAAATEAESSVFASAKPKRVKQTKVYNLGKSELPIAPDYRRGANYRSGTAAVGRRQPDEFAKARGAALGVLKPKRVAPTRLAPRNLGGTTPTKPPIPAAMVGKGLGSRVRESRRVVSVLGLPRRGWSSEGAQIRRAADKTENNPLKYDGPGELDLEREMVRRRRIRQAGTAAAAGGASYAGARAGSRDRVKKRDRRYDSEDRRQRRLGAAVAGTGVLGAQQATRGGRTVMRDTRGLAELPMDLAKRPGFTTDAKQAYAIIRNRKGVVLSRGAGVRLGRGGALLAASGGLAHHARSEANRRRS